MDQIIERRKLTFAVAKPPPALYYAEVAPMAVEQTKAGPIREGIASPGEGVGQEVKKKQLTILMEIM